MAGGQTLGGYLKELRDKKQWSLLMLAQKTGLNYPHLSRIESDSIVPTPKTVVTLSEALGGDLNLMLELAECLPKQILERLTARPTTPTPAMKRSAGEGGRSTATSPNAKAEGLARSLGVPESEVAEVADAVVKLMQLDSRRRRAVTQLMRTFDGGGGGQR
jgi:hypothetical protein